MSSKKEFQDHPNIPSTFKKTLYLKDPDFKKENQENQQKGRNLDQIFIEYILKMSNERV